MPKFAIARLGLLLAFFTGGFALHAQGSTWAWSDGSSDLNDGWRTHAGGDPVSWEFMRLTGLGV